MRIAKEHEKKRKSQGERVTNAAVRKREGASCAALFDEWWHAVCQKRETQVSKRKKRTLRKREEKRCISHRPIAFRRPRFWVSVRG